MNLNVIGVKTYFENVKMSTSEKSFKIAVMKVKYEDYSEEIVLRHALNNKLSDLNQYEDIDINQIKQISNIIDENQKPIFELYLKKYIKNNLSVSVSNNNLKEKVNIFTRIKLLAS